LRLSGSAGFSELDHDQFHGMLGSLGRASG
jgi:hypothetical protein